MTGGRPCTVTVRPPVVGGRPCSVTKMDEGYSTSGVSVRLPVPRRQLCTVRAPSDIDVRGYNTNITV